MIFPEGFAVVVEGFLAGEEDASDGLEGVFFGVPDGAGVFDLGGVSGREGKGEA